MATKKSTSGPRELIAPHEGDSRYQRRNPDGILECLACASGSMAAAWNGEEHDE